MGYEVKLIAEKNGAITTLGGQIHLTIQDGLYLGYINAKYGNGLIIWKNIWGNEAHYGPHRYEISIYTWDAERSEFRLIKTRTTKAKFRDGYSALKSYRLPRNNFRDEVAAVEQEISTLGAENKFLIEERKGN